MVCSLRSRHWLSAISRRSTSLAAGAILAPDCHAERSEESGPSYATSLVQNDQPARPGRTVHQPIADSSLRDALQAGDGAVAADRDADVPADPHPLGVLALELAQVDDLQAAV